MHYLGLDISKHTIDTYSDICGHCKIDNTIQGIQGLLEHLQANGLGKENTHICCEATNVYYLLVATTLHQNGYKVSVVNPLAIKGYAKMQLKRIKTDKQDAKLIADFAKKEKPQCWQPNNQTGKAIQSLHRRTEQLNSLLVAEKNRQETADEYTNASVEKMIAALEEELENIREQIQAIIESDEQLKAKQKILATIPGVGKNTAQILLSVLVDLEKFRTSKHLISYLGLSPIIRDSGKYKGAQKVSKMGDKTLRKSLYMPARAACTRSKLWRGWFDEQVARGKHPKQVYVMMMCKILRYAYTCLKTNAPFDATLHKKADKAERSWKTVKGEAL